MKRKVTIALITVVGFYVVLCLALYFFQEVMLFPGASFGRGDFDAPRNVRVETLRTAADKEFRIAIGEPSGPPKGVLLCFLGNGESLSSGVHRAALYADYGFTTLVTEYPGYGKSQGSPSYRSFHAAADASAVRGQELAKAGNLPLVIVGQSLGSFLAVHLAAQGIGVKLLLISPPTSIAATGQRRYPFLPVGLLLRHPFDNMKKAGVIEIPTLVIHGERDTIVDIAMGRAVAAAITGAEFHVATGSGHNDLDLSRGGAHGAVIAAHLDR